MSKVKGGEKVESQGVASLRWLGRVVAAALAVASPTYGATFVVNQAGNAADANLSDGVCATGAGVCSLRAAIEQANALDGGDSIHFDIAGAGPHTITPGLYQLVISDPVTIDGYTQPGAFPADGGSPAVLKIALDGTGATENHGLLLMPPSAGSTIRGLAIHSFADMAGIALYSDGNVIEGNHLGTNVAGTAALPNSEGVTIWEHKNNLIGGSTPAARNVLSGNSNNGVYIMGTLADSNRIEGNYIGLNAAGSAALPNSEGVLINNGGSNVVGGDEAGKRNVISGNGTGISIVSSGATGNAVRGNYIGLNPGGTSAIANGAGIAVGGSAPGTIIGGDTGVDPDYRNVISGNSQDGVLVGNGATGTLIQGNYIGTNADGTAALGNSYLGVSILTGANTIGGDTPGKRNVIASNTLGGVGIAGIGTGGNVVQGNYIGLNAAGTATLGNGFRGIHIDHSPGNLIGGDTDTDPDFRNVIAGNANVGIGIYGVLSAGNTIQGNYIGTNAAGSVDLGNASTGVEISTVPDAGVLVGGNSSGKGNLISGNQADGVRVFESSGITLQGNRIGVAADGTTPLRNEWSGLMMIDSSRNLVGGADGGQGNVIAYHPYRGVMVTGLTSSTVPVFGNSILANSIHSNGELGIDLGDPGITANDRGDKDLGPNDYQNFPIIESAAAGSTLISGTLSSKPDRSYRLEFFEVNTCDSYGNGEGQLFLGAINVTTSGRGTAQFAHTAASTITGSVTSTATDLTTGDTSEFSPCQVLSTTASPAHDVGIAGGGFRMPSGVTNQAVAPVIKIKNFGDHAEDNVPIHVTTNATSATFCEYDAADFSSDGDLDPGEVVQVTGCSIALPSIPGAYTYTLHVLHGSSTTAQGLDGNLANNTRDDGSTVK